MESLWVSGIIPGICDTLIVMLFPGKSAVPSCQVTGCRSGFMQEAVWPGGNHGALGNDSGWELDMFNCSGFCSPFAASVTVGPKSFGCGLKADSGQMCCI